MSPKSLFLKELALFLKELEVLPFQARYPKMEVPQFGRYSQALVFNHLLQGMDLV